MMLQQPTTKLLKSALHNVKFYHALFYFRWAHQLSTRNFILFCRGFSLRCWRPTVVQLSLYTAWVRPCQRESTRISSSSICWHAQREEWLHMVSHRHFPFLYLSVLFLSHLKETPKRIIPLNDSFPPLSCYLLMKLFFIYFAITHSCPVFMLVHIFVC